MSDGTKWARQELSLTVMISEYKIKNADKTNTDEYKQVIDYETEFNTLKATRNATIVTAQCPSGPYASNATPSDPNAPTECQKKIWG